MIERDVINSAIEAINGLLKLLPNDSEYSDAPEVDDAIVSIRQLNAAKEGLDKESWIDAEQVSRERIMADEIVNKAARRAARLIWKDCLDRAGIKHEFRLVDDYVKYKEILPAWVDIIKREILGE